MNRSLAKFAFGGLFLGTLVLCNLAHAQAPSQPAASAMVSPEAESNIKPLPPTTPDISADADIVADPASLLPDLPPVPPAKATLVGGTIEKLDRVRDQITVSVFGGGRMKVLIDPRTRILLAGTTTASISDLRQGQRVYVDTILDGNTIFARSIRLKASATVGESQGTVLRYRPDRGELTVRDSISPSPLRVRVNTSTRFTQGDRVVQSSTLTTGSLVAVKFSSEGNGHEVAREISILALPGTRYTFAGQVVHVDLRTGLLVINSSTDHKTYEVYLDPSLSPDENLHTGAVVTVITNFEGSRYVARSLSIDSQGK
jgi:hypothetical protein